MPTTDGIEATRQLTARRGCPRVLILTTFDLDEYVYDALRAGASGFLLKDITAERLFDAVRIIAAGDALLAPTITRRLISEFVQHNRRSATEPPGSPSSRHARPKSSNSSPRDSPTRRSRSGSSSRKRPSRPTSAASSGNSGFATAPKPSSPPTRQDSSSHTPASHDDGLAEVADDDDRSDDAHRTPRGLWVRGGGWQGHRGAQ